jgi:hypothetical protein
MSLPERRPDAGELRLLDQVAGHKVIQTYIALADQFTGRLDGEIVTIELSPGVEARLNRRAISGKVNPEPVGGATEVADEEERPER